MNPWENFDNPYQLPESAQKVIPQELGNDFFGSLDQSLQLQEKKAGENLLGGMEERGLLNSGITGKNLVEQVLGPGLQRRQQAFLPYAMQGAQIGQGQNFQREMTKTNFDNQLQYLKEQFSIEQSLMMLKAQLQRDATPAGPSFGRILGDKFAGSFGESFGQGLGKSGASALSGGMDSGFGKIMGMFGGG